MSLHHNVPVQMFVSQEYSTPPVQMIVSTWRVEPQAMMDRMVEYFLEMGIHHIRPGHYSLIRKAMQNYLKTSPEIKRMVLKARGEELKRQNNRHAG